MLSFREIQDLIVLSYDDNYISDEEFLLLYDEFESTNLGFPYISYGEFDLDSMEDDECKAEFRVRKNDLDALYEALQIPEVLNASREAELTEWRDYA